MTSKKIEWTTDANQQAIVEIIFEISKQINSDGHTSTVPSCELSIIARVDDKTVGYGEPQKINHPKAVAMIGKMGLTKENFGRVSSAIAEIKNTPEWLQKIANEEKAIQEEIEYDKHQKLMRKVMNN